MYLFCELRFHYLKTVYIFHYLYCKCTHTSASVFLNLQPRVIKVSSSEVLHLVDKAPSNQTQQRNIPQTGKESVQVERQRRLVEYCSRHEHDDDIAKSLPRKLLIYNDSIVYCRINKCASTFARYSLRKLYNTVHQGHTDKEFEAYLDHEYQEIQRKLKEKYSFFFVREPYRRLFSTFSNKFYLPKQNWAPIGPEVAQRYRKNPSNTSLQYGHDVSFKELIQYTVDMVEDNQVLDVHLRPMYLQCNPCHFNYTYMGKMETIDDDWHVMYSEWKRQGIIKMPGNYDVRDFYAKTDLPEVIHAFSTKRLLEDSGIPDYTIFLRLWRYFQITGRISKTIGLPYEKDDDLDEVEYEEYKAHVAKAIEKSKVFGEEVKAQRDEALKAAYSTIPRELLERLRKTLLPDCLMFGYDNRPAWLFDSNIEHFKTDFNYFPGI